MDNLGIAVKRLFLPIFILVTMSFFFNAVTAYSTDISQDADTKEIKETEKEIIVEAIGSYHMGDDDTILEARKKASAVAKRKAIERVGVYVKAETVVQNGMLTKDRIKTFTGSIAKSEILEENLEGRVFTVKVQVSVNRASLNEAMNDFQDKERLIVNLKEQNKKLVKDIEEYDKLAAAREYARLVRETEVVKDFDYDDYMIERHLECVSDEDIKKLDYMKIYSGSVLSKESIIYDFIKDYKDKYPNQVRTIFDIVLREANYYGIDKIAQRDRYFSKYIVYKRYDVYPGNYTQLDQATLLVKMLKNVRSEHKANIDKYLSLFESREMHFDSIRERLSSLEKRVSELDEEIASLEHLPLFEIIRNLIKKGDTAFLDEIISLVLDCSSELKVFGLSIGKSTYQEVSERYRIKKVKVEFENSIYAIDIFDLDKINANYYADGIKQVFLMFNKNNILVSVKIFFINETYYQKYVSYLKAKYYGITSNDYNNFYFYGKFYLIVNNYFSLEKYPFVKYSLQDSTLIWPLDISSMIPKQDRDKARGY